MSELQIKEKVDIETMIYEIRGKQVMLDSDLSKLYNITTSNLNKSVKRNIRKFPDDFIFQLSLKEYQDLMFQNGISKIDYRRINKALPHVFTEQGVAMLATLFHTEIAEQTSINIMRAFVAMKKYISNSLLEQKYINELVLKDNKRIDLLESTFSKFKENNNEIYFNGQIYDAYSKIIDIMKEAKDELIIVDAYADKSILDMICNINCKVVLICKSLLKQIDIDKYNKQYNNLKIIYNDTFHDRYLILDKKVLYHCGTSLNHIGEKTFSINKIEDVLLVNKLNEEIKKLV